MNELLQDIQELQWAREAFGKNPDAINFWHYKVQMEISIEMNLD